MNEGTLCLGAKALDLVPCCWCTKWVHARCSCAEPSGRACAAHFDTRNPLEKRLVADKHDVTIPDQFKRQMVVANIAFPRLSNQKAPKHIMFNIEAVWLYKHAW